MAAKLPPLLEDLKRRWQKIEEETGISLVELFFGLFTPIDDRLHEIEKILRSIDSKLGPPTRPARPVILRPEVEVRPEIEVKPPAPPGAPPVEMPTIPIVPLVDKENVQVGDLTMPGVELPTTAQLSAVIPVTVVEPSPHVITYPSEGGTKFIDTAGTVKFDFINGLVTLPDNSTESIQSLPAFITTKRNQYIRSIIIEASKDAIVELESQARATIPAGIAVPFSMLKIKTLKIVVSANTSLKLIASTAPYAVPYLMDLRTQEFYTEQFREKVTVDTSGTTVTISPPVKVVLVYAENDDIYVEFNGSIDSKSFKVPKDGSLSYPLVTESLNIKAVSSSADVYIRGLR